MAKKSGKPRSRYWKKLFEHSCGCYYCCGDPYEYHRKFKLKIPKHKPKNWIDE